ncbi:MAG TPA: hypothetical protein VJH24_04030 [Candidatus Bilamarchaeaceae archaeon]|nr:hypothetical protein [Candidatus Bilamarchaeaceae archaeon]
MRNVWLLAIFLLLFGSTGIYVYYPDGPFTVSFWVDGENIPVESDVALHSVTEVVEHRQAGSYTKSPGLTSYSDFSVVTTTPNRDLDAWFENGGEKDALLNIQDGRRYRIESWKLYRVVPLTREPRSDGSVQYTFQINYASERDTDITAPPV